MPSSYIVRSLSRDESRDFREALRRARGEGRTMRWVVARLVRFYAKHGLDTIEQLATKRGGRH